MEERTVQPNQFKYTDKVPNATLFTIQCTTFDPLTTHSKCTTFDPLTTHSSALRREQRAIWKATMLSWRAGVCATEDLSLLAWI